MSWLWRVTDRWSLDEDEQLAGTLQRLYGPLLRISFLLPSWKRSHLHITFAVMVLFILTYPAHIYILCVSVLCLRDDFNLVSMELHYLIIYVLVMLMVVVILLNRLNLIKVHKTVGSDLGQYATGRIYDENVPVRFESDKSKQTLRFIFLPSLIVLLAALTLLVPYIKKMDGEVHYSAGGANMKLPVAACYPFPTHEGALYAVAALGQLMAVTFLALDVVTMQLVNFRLTQQMIYEYRVLRYALRTIFVRAKSMHHKLHPESDPSDLDVMDPSFQKLIRRCLDDCLAHHHKIVNFFNEYSEIIRWPTAVAFFFGSAIIGLSLVNIIEANNNSNYENIALFSLMAIGEVLSMLMISLFGEAITSEDDKLRNCVYSTDWYWFDTPNMKTILNFQTGLVNPAVVSIGGVVSVNLDTFSSIMNTAYSFFNLMNAQ